MELKSMFENIWINEYINNLIGTLNVTSVSN